jgi:hypothetical protein
MLHSELFNQLAGHLGLIFPALEAIIVLPTSDREMFVPVKLKSKYISPRFAGAPFGRDLDFFSLSFSEFGRTTPLAGE